MAYYDVRIWFKEENIIISNIEYIRKFIFKNKLDDKVNININ